MSKLLNESLETLKQCCADFDKIIQTCNQKDVDLVHLQVMAENGRDNAGNSYKRINEIIQKISKAASDEN